MSTAPTLPTDGLDVIIRHDVTDPRAGVPEQKTSDGANVTNPAPATPSFTSAPIVAPVLQAPPKAPTTIKSATFYFSADDHRRLKRYGFDHGRSLQSLAMEAFSDLSEKLNLGPIDQVTASHK